MHIASELINYLKSTQAYRRQPSESEDINLFRIDGYPLMQLLRLYSLRAGARIWIICPTEDSAKQLLSDSGKALLMDGSYRTTYDFGYPVHYLRGTGKAIYSKLANDRSVYDQIEDLREINDAKSGLVITHLRPFCQQMVDIDEMGRDSLDFRVSGKFDPIHTSEVLTDAGYARTVSTTLPGDFSLRGEVMDVFPLHSQYPFRIYAGFDEIEKIAYFDPLTQETLRTVSNVSVTVAHEENNATCFVEKYFRKSDIFFFYGDKRLETSFRSLEVEARSLYRTEFQTDRNCLKPNQVLYSYAKLYGEKVKRIILRDLDDGLGPKFDSFDIEGPRSYFGDFVRLKTELAELQKNGYHIAIYTSSAAQKARLQQILKKFSNIEYLDYEISSGFAVNQLHIVAMCECELFGRRKQVVKTLKTVSTSPLDSFVDLKEGDYVVHVNYGIGKFIRIERQKSFDRERDYIKIAYSNDETLYVPIEQADLVQRYIGSEGGSPKLDSLGGQGWEHKKARARKKAEELAQYLVDLYAKRQNSIGFPFEKDNDMQLQFEALFPYEETEDQLACIDDIKHDMESNTVMDRLICGDVGYGKTEIAFRAAFKAVMSGKQVAFLAPTTILAEQHYNNFVKRCEDFPVNSALLSRNVPRKEQKLILNRIFEGGIDVVFGTHRILQNDIIYKDLGLLVVDEEQRFGVKDKEKIKTMRASIDSLSLSATPIPRTLYMSLLKIRDMSLLTTPPIVRKSIETKILEYDENLVVKAIQREVDRDGQVFYLHNRIESHDKVLQRLRERLPDVVIESAHGRMDSSDIEDIMRRFVHQSIQVLVATTIIENGIDIPNVNTIIIDRSDLYGVSQLYQLRGRVGRGDKQAYAYLFYPNDETLTDIAVKRLKTISENTELGAGFKIAMKDMELRGTGNLLGREQSGQLASVGLDMYIRILDEAVRHIRNAKDADEQEVFLEMDYTGFIPETYIKAPSVKFEIYKKIATIKTKEELNGLVGELEDRFGPVPLEVLNLLYIAEIKIICKKLHIVHLTERKGNMIVEFGKLASINPDKLLNLIKLSGGAVRYDTKRMNFMTMKTDLVSLRDKSLFILEKLERLL